MRILGLDPGERTIGVAVSDSFCWTAQALETIIRKDIYSDLERIKGLVIEWDVCEIVMGFPKNMDSTIGPQGKKAMELAKRIEEATGRKVVLWDERLTTVAAEKLLIKGDVRRKKRKKVIDKVAAAIILQGYLDSLENTR